MKIALFGEWNTTNLGDTALGISITEFLRANGFTVKVFAFGSFLYQGEIMPGADAYEVFHGWRPGRERGVARRTVLHRLLGRNSLVLTFARVIRGFLNLPVLVKELRDCSALIVGGGELLNFNHRQFAVSLFWLTRVVDITRLPVFCLGCGGNMLSTFIGTTLLRGFLKRCAYVSTRDYKTKMVLEAVGKLPVSISGDLVLTFSKTMFSAAHSYHKYIAINVRHVDDMGMAKKYFAFLCHLVKRFRQISPREELVLFTTGNREDLKTARELYRELLPLCDLKIMHPESVECVRSIVSKARIVIASRLHAAVFAWQMGVRALGLCYSGKLLAFFETLGVGAFCHDLRLVQHEKNVENSLVDQVLSDEVHSPNFSDHSFSAEVEKIAQGLSRTNATTTALLKDSIFVANDPALERDC